MNHFFLSLCFIFSGIPGERVSIEKTLESLVFELTNKVRLEKGVPPLRFNDQLQELSLIQCYNMIEHSYFAHDDHQGRSPEDRKNQYFPEVLGGIGENLAELIGVPVENLAMKAMQTWWDSPGHRKNILRPEFTHLGVGIQIKEGIFYATQTFGNLAAILMSDMNDSYQFGSEQVFQFKFVGGFDKEKLTIAVQYPDKKARFYLSPSEYYEGIGYYQPRWISENIFEIRMMLDKGRGVYNIEVGQNNLFHKNSLNFRVD